MTALALILSYVLGSVPTGLWLGQRLRGTEISKQITNLLIAHGLELAFGHE